MDPPPPGQQLPTHFPVHRQELGNSAHRPSQFSVSLELRANINTTTKSRALHHQQKGSGHLSPSASGISPLHPFSIFPTQGTTFEGRLISLSLPAIHQSPTCSYPFRAHLIILSGPDCGGVKLCAAAKVTAATIDSNLDWFFSPNKPNQSYHHCTFSRCPPFVLRRRQAQNPPVARGTLIGYANPGISAVNLLVGRFWTRYCASCIDTNPPHRQVSTLKVC